jgi:ribosomal protein L37AE/L43A
MIGAPGSRSASPVCPFCELGSIRLPGTHPARCEYCGERLSRSVLETLQQVAGLPDALGDHPCECGHPEMRRLPDGTYHCPACGSEVLPFGVPPVGRNVGGRGAAYWAGWLDGRYGANGSFVDNSNLARFEEPYDRLDYYRGHRAGREAGLSSVIDAATRSDERRLM